MANNRLEEIKSNFKQVRREIIGKAESEYRNPGEITIVSVSKTFPAEDIALAMQAGIRTFGENYAQEIKDKIKFFESKERQPDWHFIGHLQSNKVKYLFPYVSLIHTVDSINLAKEIDTRAGQYNKIQNILLQVNTSGEESKHGLEPDAVIGFAKEVQKFENINTIGLMTIGTFSDDEVIIRKEFTMLRELKEALNKSMGIIKFTELSMGMSHDYKIAIEEGATILRIGTAVFGQRQYYNV
ncbi:MAG: YggS family pyridoxal phosphate enzyme [Ignavibacteria bacterium GWF2_33_9]|nr:MAG: YggS family pyridoxal phosphate enzyme [Ignavibacteria bacterium GWF2_33_9]